MSITEEIVQVVKENPDLTISKLAEKLGQPRAKISALVEALEQEGKIQTVEVATGKVVRTKEGGSE